jgi:hypothetical protein
MQADPKVLLGPFQIDSAAAFEEAKQQMQFMINQRLLTMPEEAAQLSGDRARKLTWPFVFVHICEARQTLKSKRFIHMSEQEVLNCLRSLPQGATPAIQQALARLQIQGMIGKLTHLEYMIEAARDEIDAAMANRGIGASLPARENTARNEISVNQQRDAETPAPATERSDAMTIRTASSWPADASSDIPFRQAGHSPTESLYVSDSETESGITMNDNVVGANRSARDEKDTEMIHDHQPDGAELLEQAAEQENTQPAMIREREARADAAPDIPARQAALSPTESFHERDRELGVGTAAR